MNIQNICLLLLTFLSVACSGPQVPDRYQEEKVLPKIYPDYAEVTVPVNIAPLNFELLTGGDAAVVRFSAEGREILCEGLKARPDMDEWRKLMAASAGKAVTVEAFVKHAGQWTRFKPFNIYVSRDSIDPWLSYRLISPSYVSYEELTLNQRCLETFEERVFVDNMLCSTEDGGQCVNCHSYQQWNPDRMQFHARQAHGGTLIAYDGHVEKIDWNNMNLNSPPVYPAWHPQLKLIAYSTNKTMQAFHTADLNKIEVLDSESDLILYDVERHEVSTIENRPDELETFPCWSPDGRMLYYCSAHFEYAAGHADLEEITLRAKELKYNIYRKPFDPQTRQFGERELVFAADSLSATFPRISPDGRWLLFTMGEWGCFHIWHHDADLWIMDLRAATIEDSLKSEVHSLKSEVHSLKSEVHSLKSEVHSLKSEVHSLKSEVYSLKSEVHSLKSEVYSLKSEVYSQASIVRPLAESNSVDTESYHSWSSNGRWLVFSSRRYDGVFTRPFFTHISNDGHATKPFELPAADPDYHRQLMKSYNVPELMKGPVTFTPQQIAAELLGGASPAK